MRTWSSAAAVFPALAGDSLPLCLPLARRPGRLCKERISQKTCCNKGFDCRLRSTGGDCTGVAQGARLPPQSHQAWPASKDALFEFYFNSAAMEKSLSKRGAAAHYIAIVAMLTALAGCAPGNGKGGGVFEETSYQPAYAKGFAIMGSDTMASTVLRVYDPWQGAQGVEIDYFIRREGENPPAGFKGRVVDAGAKRVACMSSTHVAMLDAIGEVGRVAGVSGLDYVSNPHVAAHRNEIVDVGQGPNIEAIAVLRPDLLLVYSVAGGDAPVSAKLDELGVPYVFIGEYLEPSPLGKAEWMVAVAELLDCRSNGMEAFSVIPPRYESLKDKVAGVSSRPKVMVNAPWQDTWYMPSDSSYAVRLIRDAGGEYVYGGNSSNSSSAIGMETALSLLSRADIWLDAGNFRTLAELEAANPLYASSPAVTGKRVYNSDLRTNSKGANDYWESAAVRPDVVLGDLISIMHPEVYCQELYYYRKLK